MKNGQYIKGIDGLRAISVLAVIAYHYYSSFESAGYLGVDVFFVISGFVITASFANYERPGSLKEFTTEFYLRRIKRLLPALLAVVIFTSILIMLVTTGGRDSIRTGAVSLIGGANIFLYIKASDYFALTSELNPFTHMWSLAVEDQFYLLFPILFWAVGGFIAIEKQVSPKKLILTMAAICLVSLTAFIVFFNFDYSFSFYMMPTRLWQIGSGILVYLLVSNHNAFASFKAIPILIPVFILLGILGFGHHQPLLAHVAVTFVTAITLAILWHNKERESILGISPFAYIGKISYSLYLWHWPFIVLAKHTVGTTIPVIFICLVLTFVFAIASYHLIEKPIRHAKVGALFVEKEKLFQKVMTGVIVCTLALYFGVSRYAPQKTNLLTVALNVPEIPKPFVHKCHGKRSIRKFEDPLKTCLGDERTAEKPYKLYLLGDSHANQFAQTLEEILSKTQYQLQFINAESNEQGVSGLARRPDFLPVDFAYMIEDAQENDIFALSFHRGRLNRDRDVHISLDEAINLNQSTQNFISNLASALQALRNKGVKKLLLYDTPMMAYETAAQSCVIQTKLSGDNLCRVSKEQDIHTRKRQELAYDTLKQDLPDIKFWDPINSIYAGKTHHDILDEEGDYLMSDMNHITQKLATKLKPELEEILNEMIKE